MLGISYLVEWPNYLWIAFVYLVGSLVIAAVVVIGRYVQPVTSAVIGLQFLIIGLAGLFLWDQAVNGVIAIVLGLLGVLAAFIPDDGSRHGGIGSRKEGNDPGERSA